MLDKRGRDQFVIRYGDETEIYWNDAARSQAEDVYKRSTWTESFVQWSPAGNYLATIHRQGVAVWGGPSWPRLARFSHPGVSHMHLIPEIQQWNHMRVGWCGILPHRWIGCKGGGILTCSVCDAGRRA